MQKNYFLKMEHDSPIKKQVRKEITARAVMNRKIKLLEVDIDENNEKIYGVDKTNRIKKPIRKRKQKDCNYRDLSSRLIEFLKLKTELNEITRVTQNNFTH